MICNPPQTNYFFPDCSECPGHTDLENTLEDVFTDNSIENTPSNSGFRQTGVN
jgi:hypothetical protein